MAEPRRQVTLSKVQRDTAVGRVLIDLLTDLSADGIVSREEMERLRAWLEVDHGVDFPALPFLYETIDQIASDGEVTEDELDRLALAIERVLPKDLRETAAEKRREARLARSLAQREAQRQRIIAERSERLVARSAERARAAILFQDSFPVRGAFRSEARRRACGRLMVGDTLNLEREPDNVHDSNAILICAVDDSELGYVPKEEARRLAPLLDAGADEDVRVHRIWETPESHIVPIVHVTVHGGADIAVDQASHRSARTRTRPGSRTAETAKEKASGCAASAAGFLLLLLFVLVAVLGVR